MKVPLLLRPALLPPSLVAYVLAQTTFAQNCSREPIYMDVHVRRVQGSTAFQWGAFVGAGTPAQNQSSWPSLRQNQTSVASIAYCEHSALEDCQNATHGNYDPSASSSWIEDEGYRDLDSSQPFNRSYFGSEEFSLYTHYFETNPASATVVSSTLEVANVGDGNPGVVGLGPRSTLLQSLVDQSIISARTLGIYLGTSMPRANGVINGSLTWGGYDRGRFAGDVKSYDMDLSNVDAFPLTVQDVIISTADNETSTSLFDDSRFPNNTGNLSFVGRLSTDQYPISMPYQLTQNFKELLSARPSSLPDGSLGLTVPFNGTMTFVLADGFRVTLPPQILSNNSISPIQDRERDDDSPFYLGLPFLAQLYLVLDYEASRFHIATAVQENAYVMPTPFCGSATPAAYVPLRAGAFARQGLIGLAIGAPIAGLAFLATLGWVLYTCAGARRTERREKAERLLARKLKLQSRYTGLEQMELDLEAKEGKEGTPLIAKARFWR